MKIITLVALKFWILEMMTSRAIQESVSCRVAEFRHLDLFFPPRTRRTRHRPHATTLVFLDLKLLKIFSRTCIQGF